MGATDAICTQTAVSSRESGETSRNRAKVCITSLQERGTKESSPAIRWLVVEGFHTRTEIFMKVNFQTGKRSGMASTHKETAQRTTEDGLTTRCTGKGLSNGLPARVPATRTKASGRMADDMGQATTRTQVEICINVNGVTTSWMARASTSA